MVNVLNDPINKFDPTGESWEDAATCLVDPLQLVTIFAESNAVAACAFAGPGALGCALGVGACKKRKTVNNNNKTLLRLRRRAVEVVARVAARLAKDKKMINSEVPMVFKIARAFPKFLLITPLFGLIALVTRHWVASLAAMAYILFLAILSAYVLAFAKCPACKKRYFGLSMSSKPGCKSCGEDVFKSNDQVKY